MFRRTRFIALAFLLLPAAAMAEEKKDEKKPAPVYKACPKNKVWSEEQKGCICAPGFNWDTPTRSCVSASAPPPPAAPAPPPAPAPTSESKCVPGKQWSEAHNACVTACPPGKVANAKGDACVAVPKEEKPVEKSERSEKPAPSNGPKVGTKPSSSTTTPKSCPEGKEWKDAFEKCVPICPADQVLDFAGSACHPIRVVRRPR